MTLGVEQKPGEKKRTATWAQMNTSSLMLTGLVEFLGRLGSSLQPGGIEVAPFVLGFISPSAGSSGRRRRRWRLYREPRRWLRLPFVQAEQPRHVSFHWLDKVTLTPVLNGHRDRRFLHTRVTLQTCTCAGEKLRNLWRRAVIGCLGRIVCSYWLFPNDTGRRVTGAAEGTGKDAVCLGVASGDLVIHRSMTL